MIGNETDLASFAEDRGVAIDPDLARIFLFKAGDYLNMQAWLGQKSSAAQTDCWPRSGIIGVADDTIPADVVTAAYMLAMDASNGTTLINTATGGRGIKQAAITGAVSVTYDDFDDSYGTQPYFPYLDSLIGKYLNDSNIGFNIRVRHA